MKTFRQIVNEELKESRVKDVKVVFDVNPEDIVFEVPEKYAETEILQYIGDRFLKSLPSDTKVGKMKLGKNFENINDAYFEYKSYEIIDDKDIKADFEWDPEFDEKNTSDNYVYCKIHKLQYKILFDMFILMKSDNQDVKEIFDKVFQSMESSAANKYPIEIVYNSSESEFTEE